MCSELNHHGVINESESRDYLALVFCENDHVIDKVSTLNAAEVQVLAILVQGRQLASKGYKLGVDLVLSNADCIVSHLRCKHSFPIDDLPFNVGRNIYVITHCNMEQLKYASTAICERYKALYEGVKLVRCS